MNLTISANKQLNIPIPPNTYMEIQALNPDEIEYHTLLQRLMLAQVDENRTGIPAHGLFSEQLKFSLMTGDQRVLPLLTTKRMPWKAILHELIWFLRGSTDVSYLHEHGVKIWDGNSSREYLDAYGLRDYPEGTLGPIYGWQWRNGGDWQVPQMNDMLLDRPTTQIEDKCTMDTNTHAETSAPHDQLADVIHTLKTNPRSRRMIVCSWNVRQLKQMALPPCHYSFQFQVLNGELNCLVNMRSADVFLGVPFNIASYAFLVHMVSVITGIRPGVLCISMCDCHLYTNHRDQAMMQVMRAPRVFPTLQFSDRVAAQEGLSIDHFAYDFGVDDFRVICYDPHPAIRAEMAV